MNDSDFMVKIETNIAKSGYGVVILLTEGGTVKHKFMSEVSSRDLLPMIINDAADTATSTVKTGW